MFTPEPVPDGAVLAPHHFYIGILIAWFGFMFVWKYYPKTGSLLTIVGLLIAIDDTIQHMFAVKTPLHYFWWGVLYPCIKIVEGV